MALSWTLDKLGPMARTADDCGLILAAIAGEDKADRSSLPNGFEWEGPPDPKLVRRRPWKLAVPKGALDKVQPDVRKNFEKSLTMLGGQAQVTRDVPFPDFPWGPAVGTIVGAEGASAFLDLLQSGGLAKLRCARDRYAGYAGAAISAVDYLQALRLREPMKDAMNELFETYDMIATPGRASVSYPIDQDFSKAWPGVSGGPPVIPAGNLCGLPAIVIPNGFGVLGLPTSIAFMGPALSEASLVQIGVDLQSKLKFHELLPRDLEA
jgi:aspartyl-tRNA(Asn)/glutamyl-tRNA(Gln) amidotransferase subunit A